PPTSRAHGLNRQQPPTSSYKSSCDNGNSVAHDFELD
uniref:Uncharacterized protein n=1 Tax=Aegilops tauschii subsp. strangulata TaxID=200361 RepID=A0A453JV92_AEGTS